jgi:hypothetical protein
LDEIRVELKQKKGGSWKQGNFSFFLFFFFFFFLCEKKKREKELKGERGYQVV